MAPPRDDAAVPTPDELKAYSEGCLVAARFDVVDRWLAALDPATQEQLLSAPHGAGSLAAAAAVIAGEASGPFNPERGGGTRFIRETAIGAGGMGIVDLVTDRVLGRDIVVKRCRPRRTDEDMNGYRRRQQLFKREAQLTAQLEHPGIVPVHDVGEGPLGEPAFTMKRLEGEPLSAIVARRRAGEILNIPQAVEILLRVADAVGYAHSRGLVHRDLKPDNIMVGKLGAVYVIDWGLAGTIGTESMIDSMTMPSRKFTGPGMGTPAWMAPEQFGQVKADPRMDVFAIGGLLMASLTGRGPRDRGVVPGASAINLQPLEMSLPRGLLAVIRRCLEIDPARRYADATQVADDLRRWLASGLTTAENPGSMARLLSAMRRSRGLSAALVGVLVAMLCLSIGELWWEWSRKLQARADIESIAEGTPPSDVNRLREARLRVEYILSRYPDLPSAKALDATLLLQIAGHEQAESQASLAGRLQELAHQVKVRGPWVDEIRDFTTALHDCGLSLTAEAVDADATRISHSALREELLAALAYLERAEMVSGSPSPLIQVIPRLISGAAPNDAWRGVASLLDTPVLISHDLQLPDRPAALVAVATVPQTADLVLSLFSPEDREGDDDAGTPPPSLRPLIEARLREAPGAFWPRVAAGRAALAIPDYHAVEKNAWVAMGTEPQSVWPHLLLAYTELAAKDWANVLTLSIAGLSSNPEHAELIVLRVVAMAGLGSKSEAQQVLDDSGTGALLRWHLHHPVGHPLERGIDEMVRGQGITIPAADPVWGPLAVARPRNVLERPDLPAPP